MDLTPFLSHPQKTVKGSKGGPGSAVSPYPSFNPSSDVAALHNAITVKGKYVFPKQSPPGRFTMAIWMATKKGTYAVEKVCFILKIKKISLSNKDVFLFSAFRKFGQISTISVATTDIFTSSLLAETHCGNQLCSHLGFHLGSNNAAQRARNNFLSFSFKWLECHLKCFPLILPLCPWVLSLMFFSFLELHLDHLGNELFYVSYGWWQKLLLKLHGLLFPGVDEATIIDILTKRNNAQRQQIKAAYLQEKGKVGWSGKLRYSISITFMSKHEFWS